MDRYLRSLDEIDGNEIALVGGKAANLGELRRMGGIDVPDGFVVTTEAFGRELALADRIDEQAAYAVRSSATLEDSPQASFAGQHDTYLDVVGAAEIRRHVERCWASLSNERAVAYRAQHGFAEAKARMAVVVQRMVRAEVSGVMFTADPITSNRKVVAIEASAGLGEAFVSGRVNASSYQVRAGAVSARNGALLTDELVLRLAAMGRRIETHFGRPQDIEWCLAEGRFWIVQSRPITTLFPIPAAPDDANRVYISVGHNQMMTDAMKPLGLSFFQRITPGPMVTVGSRLFVDVTARLGSPATRAALLAVFGRSDPLIRDAIESVLERGFIPALPDEPRAAPAPAPTPPPGDVLELIAKTQASIAEAKRGIAGKSGIELLDFIIADIQELRRVLFDPGSHRAIMTGMEATWWLNDRLAEWLGEKNAADALAQSVAHNVTSEMGLALLDVADAVRPHLELVRRGEVAELPAVMAWLAKYGMRCVGEIDITRPRWSEDPASIAPLLMRNITSFEPGEAARRFERGKAEATKKEHELLARVRALPDGEAKAADVKRMIDRVRAFSGYREYPKYGMVSRLFVYRASLIAESARLVEAGVTRAADDIFFLTLEELHDAVRMNRVDHALVATRRAGFAADRTLTPPRVLTSEGECVTGSYRRDVPAGALIGLPVSAGTVEGRARIAFDVGAADLEAGDILVTPFTDPSWTPVFVAIKGLVTEVGGLMTHGAVIAREYGLPAIVGVEGATRRIRDGQRIRVHGTAGYVELLD